MLRFLVLAIIVPGNITKRGTGLGGGLGWKDESDRGPWKALSFVCGFYNNGFINRVVNGQCVYGKKTPGGAGTHTGHTGAHGHTDHTDEPHNHPNPPGTHPHDKTRRGPNPRPTQHSTAGAPEPTAPRGRFRRSRPPRTRPCRLPLPERLPAPARRRSAIRRNEPLEMKALDGAAGRWRAQLNAQFQARTSGRRTCGPAAARPRNPR
jgi:hypothetical protein